MVLYITKRKDEQRIKRRRDGRLKVVAPANVFSWRDYYGKRQQKMQIE